jgi:ABC-type dipeptide/oligopeptide/nickel transport system permease component
VTSYVRLAQAPAQALRFLTLPVIALGFSNAAAISRMARSGMLEILSPE